MEETCTRIVIRIVAGIKQPSKNVLLAIYYFAVIDFSSETTLDTVGLFLNLSK